VQVQHRFDENLTLLELKKAASNKKRKGTSLVFISFIDGSYHVKKVFLHFMERGLQQLALLADGE
jgi:hypothetical protein